MTWDLGALSQTLGRTLEVDNSGDSWFGGRWWQRLQPGSWRGVGFVMDAAETKTGRRVAVHEYPYRDTVWPEDLGKLPRRFSFQAFIVGDDCYERRDAMVAACEQAGAGTLVHPTLGVVQCVLLDFTTTDRRERGRVVELAFQFIIAGDIQPQSSIATGDNVIAMAGALNLASASDLSSMLSAQRLVPQYGARGVTEFAAMATSAVDDPTRALNSVAGLQGLYGRYATGRRTTLLPNDATVGSVLSQSITTRQNVYDAAGALVAASGAL